MKRCPVCTERLPLERFALDRTRKDGHMNRCKDCDNTRSKAYYARRPRPAPTPRACGDCSAPVAMRRRYCDACRDRRRGHRRHRGDVCDIQLYDCHHCSREHVAGRCPLRIGKTADELRAMTPEQMLAWASGQDDHVWTPDDWAVHTIAIAMDISGHDALRVHRLRHAQ